MNKSLDVFNSFPGEGYTLLTKLVMILGRFPFNGLTAQTRIFVSVPMDGSRLFLIYLAKMESRVNGKRPLI
jgi:hypothetical protein